LKEYTLSKEWRHFTPDKKEQKMHTESLRRSLYLQKSKQKLIEIEREKLKTEHSRTESNSSERRGRNWRGNREEKEKERRQIRKREQRSLKKERLKLDITPSHRQTGERTQRMNMK